MNLVKFRNSDLLDTINTFFKDFPTPELNSGFTPKVEITEDRDNFYLNLELPGIKKEDIKINVENNVLTVKGTKNQTYNKEEKEPCGKREVLWRIQQKFQSQ
ncbi:MAG: Molecular chaperone (small heat shock protein) [Chlorobi bacterium OLB4]|nr:MAG: Molecular chaperone (small heat shock protein) [Chlorobi bacterium OLB4]